MGDSLSVSIIIPCRDDYKHLLITLSKISKLYPKPEIIVCDASKKPSMIKEICINYNAKFIKVSSPSRGNQLDAGAELAGSKILLFHHADTDFSQDHYNSLMNLFRTQESIIGGAFLKDIGELYPSLKVFSWLHRLYTTHIGTLYGDQSIFVLRSVFTEMGGFGDLPLMEDVNFSSRLRDYGNVSVITPAIKSSSRKFSIDGKFKRKIKNIGLIFLYRLGVSPDELVKLYYDDKTSGA